MVAKGRDAAVITAKRVMRWKEAIEKSAAEFALPPSIIAAIISRETAGLDLYCQVPPKGRLGDNGFGAGPMQIDLRSFPVFHALWKTGQLTVEDGIQEGCRVLRMKLEEVQRYYDIPAELKLQAAVAAYNCGVINVRKALKAGRDVDAFTTGADYSKDVTERAAHFAANGFCQNDDER